MNQSLKDNYAEVPMLLLVNKHMHDLHCSPDYNGRLLSGTDTASLSLVSDHNTAVRVTHYLSNPVRVTHYLSNRQLNIYG